MTDAPARRRYVVLGLAHVRSPWFRDVARWSTGGTVPVDFAMCLSAEELHVRLGSGRMHSALLLDGTLPDADRSLVAAACSRGTAVLVVDDPTAPTDWMALGAAAVVPRDLQPDVLLHALHRHATPIGAGEGDPVWVGPDATARPPGTGKVVVVTGTGGVGTSTCAMTVAAAFGRESDSSRILLADLARHADQAMLHDLGDVLPGLPEVVDAHRRTDPPTDTVRALCHHLPTYGHSLLLGLRRHRDWTALPTEPLARALDTLRSTFDVVVCDVDPDLEGERETGSLDVEDRNAATRAALALAGAVVAVGGPGVKGTHALTRLLRTLTEHELPAARLVPAVNRAPRAPQRRREQAQALAAGWAPPDCRPEPLFLPDRRDLESRLRHGAPPPVEWIMPLVRAVRRTLAAAPAVPPTAPEPVRVRPGRMGSLAGAEP